jgi:phosphohistidine phosphatase SixA
VRACSLLLAFAAACAATPPAAPPAAGPASVAILVRHAEKMTDDPEDPLLAPAGETRAAALAEALRDVRPTHLFATQYRRTRLTLQPLAQASGLPVREIPAGDTAAWLEALRGLPPGSTAVVAGHSNTIPGLVQALGGDPGPVETAKDGPRIPDHEHDRLYLLSLDGPRVRAVLLRYGAPSTMDAAR